MQLLGRATVDTLVAVVVVFALQIVTGVLGLTGLFVLRLPLVTDPWTLVTSVYAHSGPGHLAANVVALLFTGPLVARRTTRLRFHAFFLSMGALTGVAQVVLGGLLGTTGGVLGASGAVFALLGYLLSGNVVAARLLDRVSLSPRAQFLLFLAIAVLITLATAAPRAALIGHGTGLLLGLVAGRARLLDVADSAAGSGRPGRSAN